MGMSDEEYFRSGVAKERHLAHLLEHDKSFKDPHRPLHLPGMRRHH